MSAPAGQPLDPYEEDVVYEWDDDDQDEAADYGFRDPCDWDEPDCWSCDDAGCRHCRPTRWQVWRWRWQAWRWRWADRWWRLRHFRHMRHHRAHDDPYPF